MLKDQKEERIRIADKMFNTLHENPEVDQFLDKGKEYFKKKYGIDYFSVHMVHHKKSCFLGFFDHDEWHEWTYKYHGGMTYPKREENIFTRVNEVIKPNEIYIEYFDSYIKSKESNVRADIFGVRKYGGCTIITSDNLNNITEYDLTFADDSAFGTLDKKVLYALTADLIRYRSLLLPFINHVDQFGDFSDKLILHKSMDQFIRENPSLFHF